MVNYLKLFLITSLAGSALAVVISLLRPVTKKAFRVFVALLHMAVRTFCNAYAGAV